MPYINPRLVFNEERPTFLDANSPLDGPAGRRHNIIEVNCNNTTLSDCSSNFLVMVVRLNFLGLHFCSYEGVV